LRSLINENINNGLNDIVTKLFEGNRICDRAMSVLSVKFAMNKTVDNLHPKLAHLYPKLADVISDYQGARNNLTVYGATPLDSIDYNSPQEFFEKILDYQNDLEALVTEIRDRAENDPDITTKSFLEKFLIDLIPVTSQCLLLVDKGEAYKDWMLFDANVEDFIILE
jgi:ferritin